MSQPSSDLPPSIQFIDSSSPIRECPAPQLEPPHIPCSQQLNEDKKMANHLTINLSLELQLVVSSQIVDVFIIAEPSCFHSLVLCLLEAFQAHFTNCEQW
ncbi:hypothetical protein Scep_024689 [Stephania cephalantha]|uniref:Uncharacterized protein n=1 Tax=Stephania cephalantha TaxID=152367 RepID=A0AAP0F615_9MAGN